jgi:hypothetical protein
VCTSLLPLPVGYALYTYDVSCRGVCVCVCVFIRGVCVFIRQNPWTMFAILQCSPWRTTCSS